MLITGITLERVQGCRSRICTVRARYRSRIRFLHSDDSISAQERAHEGLRDTHSLPAHQRTDNSGRGSVLLRRRSFLQIAWNRPPFHSDFPSSRVAQMRCRMCSVAQNLGNLGHPQLGGRTFRCATFDLFSGRLQLFSPTSEFPMCKGGVLNTRPSEETLGSCT